MEPRTANRLNGGRQMANGERRTADGGRQTADGERARARGRLFRTPNPLRLCGESPFGDFATGGNRATVAG